MDIWEILRILKQTNKKSFPFSTHFIQFSPKNAPSLMAAAVGSGQGQSGERLSSTAPSEETQRSLSVFYLPDCH